MKRTLYVETSVVSYLTAQASNGPIVSACQNVTRTWWNTCNLSFDTFISPFVVEEASAGDPFAAAARLVILRSMPVLSIGPEVQQLAEFLVLGGGLPAKARLDSLHVACAAYHDIDVLATWNCRHIANAVQLPVMRGLCAAKGYRLPELVTPFQLLEVSP